MENKTFELPQAGYRYIHATGKYVVDWVCSCGDNEIACLGLSGDSMTWTGTMKDFQAEGFKKILEATNGQV
jgi:hypothetical protein